MGKVKAHLHQYKAKNDRYICLICGYSIPKSFIDNMKYNDFYKTLIVKD